MPARIRLTKTQHALVLAVQAGRVATYADLAKAMGTDTRKASQTVCNAERSGIVSLARAADGRAFNVASIKITKHGTKLLAATGPASDGDSKPFKGKPTRGPKRQPRVVVEKFAPAMPLPTGLMGSTALLLDAEQIARIRVVVTQARAACDELETLAATAESSPTIAQVLRTAIDRALPAPALVMPASAIGLWASVGAEPAPTAKKTRQPKPAKRKYKPRAPKVPAIREPRTNNDDHDDDLVEALTQEDEEHNGNHFRLEVLVGRGKFETVGEFPDVELAKRAGRREARARRIVRIADGVVLQKMDAAA